jgi:hypothetical protein
MARRRWQKTTPEERSQTMRRLAFKRWLTRDMKLGKKPKEGKVEE